MVFQKPMIKASSISISQADEIVRIMLLSVYSEMRQHVFGPSGPYGDGGWSRANFTRSGSCSLWSRRMRLRVPGVYFERIRFKAEETSGGWLTNSVASDWSSSPATGS